MRDYTVAFLRVVSMFMIIVCHLGTYYDMSFIGQFFQVGVHIFLFMSGYLYSQKYIKNYFTWMQNRISRIVLPTYVFFVIIIIINICLGNHSDKLSYILYGTQLEGLSHIVTSVQYAGILGASHTWFVTAILGCYGLLMIIKKCERKSENISRIFLVIFIIAGIILGQFYIRIDYFIIYLMGYICGKNVFVEKCSKRCLVGKGLLSIGCIVLGMGIRLIGIRFFDDTILYLYYIIPSSYIILTVGIFYFIKLMERWSSAVLKWTDSKAWNHLDHISFYVYLTHYMFLVGPYKLLNEFNSCLIGMLIYFIVVFASAEVLSVVSEKLSLKLIKEV